MKFSEIQKLYRKTNTKKLDKKFYIEFYQFSIDSIEKIEDKIIAKAFKDAANCNCNIEQFMVQECDNHFYLVLWKTDHTIALKVDLNAYNQKFDFHGFTMWISMNPYNSGVALEWSDNGFDREAALGIFGEYLIQSEASKAIISRDFFTQKL